MAKDDGGPAFPQPIWRYNINDFGDEKNITAEDSAPPGMTLFDYYVGQCLPAIISTNPRLPFDEAVSQARQYAYQAILRRGR